MADKDELGRRGERIARERLIADGHEIIDANWRCPRGELDIVSRDGDWLVFTEVKTRSSTRCGHPLEAVTGEKLRRLRELAGRWREANPDARGRSRIDVVAVVAPRVGEPEIVVVRAVGP